MRRRTTSSRRPACRARRSASSRTARSSSRRPTAAARLTPPMPATDRSPLRDRIDQQAVHRCVRAAAPGRGQAQHRRSGREVLSRADARQGRHDSQPALPHVGLRGLRAAGLHDSGVDEADDGRQKSSTSGRPSRSTSSRARSTRYSNTNFNIAGLIVEKVSGEPFWAFLSRRVLKPLGMTHTIDLDTEHDKLEPTGYIRNALGPLRPADHGSARLVLRRRRDGDAGGRSAHLGHQPDEPVAAHARVVRRDGNRSAAQERPDRAATDSA